MDPSLVIWMGPRLEIINGCELGVPHGGFLGKISDKPDLGDMECFLVGNVKRPPDPVSIYLQNFD